MMMGFIRIDQYHPLSHLVVQNPHYVASACETCEICKLPFNFTNMDLHIEGGCAEKIMKLRKEKEAKERADRKKMGLKVPKVKSCKKTIAKPTKKDEKRKPLSTKVSITVRRCKPMNKSNSRRLQKK